MMKFDWQLCKNTAHAFLMAANYCDESDKHAQASSLLFEDEAFFAIPAVVNAAFACELYLKALIIKSNASIKEIRRHDLHELYLLLPEWQKERLTNEYSKRFPYPRKVSIEETFEIHKKVFETWRYIYESKNISAEAYPENLILAAEIIDMVVSCNE